MSEVRVRRPGGDDQRVVADGRRLDVVDALKPDRACVRVDARDLALQDPDVGTLFEQGAQWVGDLPRRQRSGRHLIGQRLKEVEVAAIDQRDLHACVAQRLDGA